MDFKPSATFSGSISAETEVPELGYFVSRSVQPNKYE